MGKPLQILGHIKMIVRCKEKIINQYIRVTKLTTVNQFNLVAIKFNVLKVQNIRQF